MKYLATFTANNGSTRQAQAMVFTNKAKAIAHIKDVVRGEHFHQSGNKSNYMVTDENDVVVAAGSLHDCGWWFVDHELIGHKY